MAATWKVLTYFAFTLPNRSGEVARFAGSMKAAGISMLGLWGYAEGNEDPRISCVPESESRFRTWADQSGLVFEEGSAFYLVGADRLGALEEILQKVSGAGINLDAVECVAAGDEFGCFIWVSGTDETRLATLLT